MANYHLMVNTRQSEKLLENFNSFYQELKTLGYNLYPDGTVEATEQEAQAILKLAKKNHISLKLIKI
ncbi:hypothetical protein [uncultured Alistipes sp.]|jgi:exoribonuclease R|uniref:hypothetical protein n=1 Tax=uncultured Alistipes sp. TaxID=538949 RepID=UPI0025F77170|nr:hypothetical protein [uncultured Alistipes sp.]